MATTCNPPSGSIFPLGTTSVTCSATDSRGNSSQGNFNVTVQDTTGPALQLPADLVIEAESALGTEVTYAPTAVDVVNGSVPVDCSPVSPSIFPLGESTVECTAVDSHQNSTSGSFTVTVQDTTPPDLVGIPGDLVLEATGSAGAAASWENPEAEDIVDGEVPVSCSPLSGTMFAVGVHIVACSASDIAGNIAQAQFHVTVQDTTPPVLSAPDSLMVEANTATGAVTSFPVSALDLVSGEVVPVCNPSNGSLLSLGTTRVTCTASDTSNNSVSRGFDVIVSFAWSGWLSPINGGTTSRFKYGGEVPLRMKLVGQSSSVTNAQALVYVSRYQNGESGPELPAGSKVPGGTTNRMGFDVSSGEYQFALDTSDYSIGTWLTKVDLLDGRERHTLVTLQ